MTKKLFILCMAFVWAATMTAQNIAVVSPEGETSLYKTLQEATKGAEPESVIYLPGGIFEGNDTITKKLTIIGVGSKPISGNSDGSTYLSGDIFFSVGSDGSAVMGCRCNQLRIGYRTIAAVNDFLLMYNHIERLYICSKSGTIINQNFINTLFGFSGISASGDSYLTVKNNIIVTIEYTLDSVVSNNIIVGGTYNIANGCTNIVFTNNIFMKNSILSSSCKNCILSGNMAMTDTSEDCINIGSVDWNDVFVKYDRSNLWNCDFHFKDEYNQYQNQVGIYAGDGFNDKQMAPVPYIVSKHIDEQTDAQGKLNIRVRVKAGDTE